MEEIHDRGGARSLGISNTYDIRVLRQLFSEARVKPTVLQNRFYADSGYDEEIRQFCAENGIAYQSFWTLTANPHILKTYFVAFYALLGILQCCTTASNARISRPRSLLLLS
jgi:diketogulonate reductase-like aldo/keto reductase